MQRPSCTAAPGGGIAAGQSDLRRSTRDFGSKTIATVELEVLDGSTQLGRSSRGKHQMQSFIASIGFGTPFVPGYAES